jgi:hypothetical protein
MGRLACPCLHRFGGSSKNSMAPAGCFGRKAHRLERKQAAPERLLTKGSAAMSASKVFLYAEIQVSVPFREVDWPSINIEMKKERGLKSKTWLSGIGTNTIGGFYEFDLLENARAYAEGYLARAAKSWVAVLRSSDLIGDVAEGASRGIRSPYYEPLPNPFLPDCSGTLAI